MINKDDYVFDWKIHMFKNKHTGEKLNIPSISKLKNYLWPFNKEKIIIEMAKEIQFKDLKKKMKWETALKLAKKRMESSIEKGKCVHHQVDYFIKNKGKLVYCDHNHQTHKETLKRIYKDYLVKYVDFNHRENFSEEPILYLSNDVCFYGIIDFYDRQLTLGDEKFDDYIAINLLEWKTTSEARIEEEDFQISLEYLALKQRYENEGKNVVITSKVVNPVLKKNKRQRSVFTPALNYENEPDEWKKMNDNFLKKLNNQLIKAYKLWKENEIDEW